MQNLQRFNKTTFLVTICVAEAVLYLEWWEKEQTRTAPCSFYFQTKVISINSSLQLMPLLIIHYTLLTLADSNIFDIILTPASKTFPGSEMQPFVILKLHLMQNNISAFILTKTWLSISAGKSQSNTVSIHTDLKLGHDTSRHLQNLRVHLQKWVNGFQFVTGFKTTNWMQSKVV